MPDLEDRPVDVAEFECLLVAAGGWFERAPHLAVAVSGGADSLCLCLLAHAWAAAGNGTVVALTVDHGLRPDSAVEAARVGDWLRARGISHEILPWRGAKPRSGVQAAAREARYRHLGAWCRAAGTLHLLLAHHLDDQAETVAIRSCRGSGPDGLAGIPAVREIAGLRLLRPLLSVPRRRLVATLMGLNQTWIVDPSNLDPAFDRGRLRRAAGHDNPALAAQAAAAAAVRGARDRAIAAWLAAHLRIDPAGFAVLDPDGFTAADATLTRGALGRLLTTIGGRAYPPASAGLARLHADLGRQPRAGARTFAGCEIRPWRRRLLICREPALAAGPTPVGRGRWQDWDGRFQLRLAGPWPAPVIGALGERGLRQRRALAVPGSSARLLPARVRLGLPAIWSGDRLLALPHLGWRAPDLPAEALVSVRFRPRHPVATAPFATARYRGGDHGPLLRTCDRLC